MKLETLVTCPICSNQSFQQVLVAKDHTVTQKDFSLQQCAGCNLLITNPRPDQISISEFYQSEKYISHSGGNKNLFDWLYLKARTFTLQWKLSLISNYKRGGKLLDYGCGTGEFLDHMKKSGWTVDGVEPSKNAREKAIALVGSDIREELKSFDTKFDIITLWHVLEHVHSLNETILKLKSYLNEDGIILIAVPNYESADAVKYGAHWAGYDVPRHLWHFSESCMKKLLLKNGFTCIASRPMKLDSFYVSLLSEGYKRPERTGISKMIHATLSGFQSNHSAGRSGKYSSLIYIAKHA